MATPLTKHVAHWRSENARTKISRWTNCQPQLVSSDEERDHVPGFFVVQAARALEGRGLSVEALLSEAGISPELLLRPEARIPPGQFGRFWELTAEALDDEFFCQDERGMPRGSYTLLCHSVMYAETLERAIRRIARFYRVLLTDFDAQLTVHEGLAELRFINEGPPRTAFGDAILLVLILGTACWLIDRSIPIHCAEFRSDAGDGEEHYRSLLGDNIAFDRPETLIRFSAEYLSIRPRRDELQMKRFLREGPGVFLTQYRSRDSLSARISQQLRQTQPENWPTFEELAAALNTTPSTLRRRLEEEQNCYQQIKDGVRRERAIRELRENEKSNAEIAEELGFGDPSTFYRAFKKWTGATPNAYRSPLRALQ